MSEVVESGFDRVRRRYSTGELKAEFPHGRLPDPWPERSVEDDESGYAFRRAYDAVKDEISVADVLLTLTDGRYATEHLHSRRQINCVLPDHEDRTPSFVAYPENGSWYCFGCLRGGDVIDLWQLACGMASSWEAVVGLSLEFGVELPERSQGWKDARSRREKYLELHVEGLAYHLRKRVFRVLEMPWIGKLEDPKERKDTTDHLWEIYCRSVAFRGYARQLVARCEERRVRWAAENG